MKQLLQRLTDAFGPSGHESGIRELIRKEVRGLADDVRVDALGNLIVHKRPAVKARGGAWRKIMVAPHMDEIGLAVTHVDGKGFVRFTSVGYLYPRNLPGARVRFLNGTAGVIGIEPMEKPADVPPLDRMYIDVGATSPKDCPVQVGDVAGFERPFLDLGQRVVAKAMDDRIGCAVAIEALRKLGRSPNDVYIVFTTQEEVTSHGALTSAYGIDPDAAFALDVTTWGDTPGIRGFDIALGKGPAIKIRDTGMISDPRVVNWMVKTAERNRIPYQREVLVGGTTDASAIQLVRSGVPVGCVSIPCRYVHSASEMIDIRDAENALKLVVALLKTPIDLSRPD
ncbi:MAG TPA: M42 family metallopeptidase [Anaerolineales bacterium]